MKQGSIKNPLKYLEAVDIHRFIRFCDFKMMQTKRTTHIKRHLSCLYTESIIKITVKIKVKVEMISQDLL